MSNKAIQALNNALHPSISEDDLSIGTVIKWTAPTDLGTRRYAAIKTTSVDWHTTYDDIPGAVSFDGLVTLLIEMKAKKVAVSDPSWTSSVWEWI